MINFLIAILVFSVAIGFMALSLHFSKYKKRGSGSCSSHGDEKCGTCSCDHE